MSSCGCASTQAGGKRHKRRGRKTHRRKSPKRRAKTHRRKSSKRSRRRRR